MKFISSLKELQAKHAKVEVVTTLTSFICTVVSVDEANEIVILERVVQRNMANVPGTGVETTDAQGNTQNSRKEQIKVHTQIYTSDIHAISEIIETTVIG